MSQTKGRTSGAGNLGKEGTMNLLRIIEKHLPIGSEDWEDVVLEHGLHFPGRGRTALMRKCSTLCQKQIPTGDPNCPEEVKLAKRIKHMILNKAAVGDAEEFVFVNKTNSFSAQ